MKQSTLLFAGLALAAMVSTVYAQKPIVYPAKGEYTGYIEIPQICIRRRQHQILRDSDEVHRHRGQNHEPRTDAAYLRVRRKPVFRGHGIRLQLQQKDT
jgi:hypothetical protein